MAFLPFHCPTFRTSHLLEPCQKNLARVKALREAKKHVGPIEKCVECKGKMLVKKAESPEYVTPERKRWEPRPEVTTAPLFLKDVYHPALEVDKKEPEMRHLSPEKIKKTREAVQRMAERYKKPPKNEEIVPELPPNGVVAGHDHGEFVPFTPKQEEIVPAVKITEKEAVKLGIVAPDIFEQVNAHQVRELEAPDGTRYCPTHPETLQRKDKLGRWMGMCDECLSARGKKCGEQNFERGVTAPPLSIPLNLARYSELKQWLIDKADDECRTLQMQIIHILREAWRQEK